MGTKMGATAERGSSSGDSSGRWWWRGLLDLIDRADVATGAPQHRAECLIISGIARHFCFNDMRALPRCRLECSGRWLS